jgi:L-rhamnose mutarotase
MERVCFTFEIYEGMEEEYQKRHDEIWPEMVRDIEAAGFTNYSLFRRGTNVVGYFEAIPDAKTASEKMGKSEVNAKWAEWFKEVIVNLTDTNGNLMVMKEVWHLD